MTFNNFYKTKLCPWYIKGSCHWGVNCNYAHTLSEQREAVDLTKTKLCPTWLRQGVCTDPKCRFAHDYSELRATTDVFKTSLCSFFIKGIPCPMESRCRFAHGVHELRQRGDSGLAQKMLQNRALALRASASAKSGSLGRLATEARMTELHSVPGENTTAGTSRPPPVARVLVPSCEGGHVPFNSRAEALLDPVSTRRPASSSVLVLDKETSSWRPERLPLSAAPTMPSFPLVEEASGNLEGTIEALLQTLQQPVSALGTTAWQDPRAPKKAEDRLSMVDFSNLLSTVAAAIASAPLSGVNPQHFQHSHGPPGLSLQHNGMQSFPNDGSATADAFPGFYAKTGIPTNSIMQATANKESSLRPAGECCSAAFYSLSSGDASSTTHSSTVLSPFFPRYCSIQASVSTLQAHC